MKCESLDSDSDSDSDSDVVNSGDIDSEDYEDYVLLLKQINSELGNEV